MHFFTGSIVYGQVELLLDISLDVVSAIHHTPFKKLLPLLFLSEDELKIS